jgi:putative tryptophan/tyrosine transport system substrate-binding protein
MQFDQLERRAVLTGMAATAAAAYLPRRAGAQASAATLRVGSCTPLPRARSFLQGFDARMRELGYVEGQNYTMDYIDLQGRTDRYRDAMQQLVDRKADVLVAFGPEESLKSALAATQTIPIVMVAIDYDPIALGYVASLARPTGNITGIVLEQIELAAKRLQLVKDALPAISKAMVFWDALSADQWRATRDNAAKLGFDLAGIELRDYPYDYARALAQVPPDHRGFLFAMTSPLFARDRDRIVQFTLLNRLPSIFVFREYVDQGGLASYGPNRTVMSRRTADYVHRIARGAKPSELPIERPTIFELVINLRTAKALGLEFSQAMLLRADEVIE